MHTTTISITLAALLVTTGNSLAQSFPGEVTSHQKISDLAGGFTGGLQDGDFFGFAAAGLGDVDGDGIGDLAVGSIRDPDGFTGTPGVPGRGAVWILFLNADGTVKSHQKISSTQGGFTGVLDDGDQFGYAVGGLGDFDGDSIPDVGVGAIRDDDGGGSHGALWLLFLNADGTVKAHQKISTFFGGFTADLDPADHAGTAVIPLGDLDGDLVDDIALGVSGDDDGLAIQGADHATGAVYVLFMNADGTVKSHQKISNLAGGLSHTLLDGDIFGDSLANLGDLDGDGVVDIAVGAPNDDTGGSNRGAVFVLFLNTDGTVKAEQRISDTEGGFGATLDDGDQFGVGIAAPGDVDGDGVADLLAGANRDGDGGLARGAVYVLLLNTDGTVKAHAKVSDTAGNFTGAMDDADQFGTGVGALGDHDGDGVPDVVVGAFSDDDGGLQRGAVWILFLHAGSWSDLGFGLAGAHGVPSLTGEGSLLAGDAVTLTLTGALENTTAWLVLGLSNLTAPFKGGTLVPNPDFFFPLPSGPAGTLVVPEVWPVGVPSGFTSYFQYWIQDAAGPKGFSASNGLGATTP